MSAREVLEAPRTEAELEERLSRPDAALVADLRRASGDILVLGAGGKMGPSLSRMARRAADEIGDGRRVIAVSRFSSADAVRALHESDVETVRADIADPRALADLPDAPNVVFMAGQKFGTSDRPSRTWVMNVVVPARVAERYASSRVVAFSTGNVYPLAPIDSSGCREGHALTPVGEYANSCVGRERVLEDVSLGAGTPLALVRLSYAVDLRYGVLVDIASKVAAGEPVDVRMGYANVIWQGDANRWALRLLARASSPPLAVNVTGAERLRVRHVATRFGELLGRPARVVGEEAPDALLSDTSLARSLFGEPSVDAELLIEWVAAWISGGGRLLGRPTHFETRDGRY